MTAYPRLFEPFSAGRLQLPNRIVVTPHGTSMVRDGALTDDDIAYYEARARCGPALIIGGAIIAHPTSSLRLRSLVEGYDPRVIEGLKRRSDAIHAHGVKTIGQIVHLGRELIGGESNYARRRPRPFAHRATFIHRTSSTRAKSPLWCGPIGVCGSIMPWNGPSAAPLGIAPPLACGGSPEARGS